MNEKPLNFPQDETFPPQGKGEVLLLVDSEKSVLEMASIVFGLAGYKVITADNSAKAFEIYHKQSKKIDAVLLDWSMPAIGGVTLSRKLVDINPRAKIIVSGRQDFPQNELELRKLGVRYFLSQPYNVTELLKAVHETIHPGSANQRKRSNLPPG